MGIGKSKPPFENASQTSTLRSSAVFDGHAGYGATDNFSRGNDSIDLEKEERDYVDTERSQGV